MKVRCIYRDSKFLKYNKIYEVLEQSDKSYKVKDEDGEESYFYKWKFEVVKEMEKTFKEVIADIKYMELWICRNCRNCKSTSEIRIFKDKTGIQITDENANSVKWFSDEWKFKLQRKEYTFEEAFKAYEEGKEIESCITRTRYKIENRKHKLAHKDVPFWTTVDDVVLTGKELKGKWYINEVD